MEMAYMVSNGHVTPKGQICEPNTLRARYHEHNWRCLIPTIANYYLVYCEAVELANLERQLGFLFCSRTQRLATVHDVTDG